MNIKSKSSDIKVVRFKSSGERCLYFSLYTSHPASYGSQGFTLVEILISITILAIVMSILYGTFSTSSTNVKIIEDRADELSSLAGAIDVVSNEIRSIYPPMENYLEEFLGKKDRIVFTSLTHFVKDDDPAIQKISYLFEDGQFIRRTWYSDSAGEVKKDTLLLNNINESSFSYFDGEQWIDDWPDGKNIPSGVRIAFFYQGRQVESVIPVISRR
ncbi:MAG: hypothetical protein A3I04_05345 [Nitrospinae bacterium RIFCSPLOWO2_02_FULL_39_110]|nr:MAG: hypothetical protein A2W53_07245 [Nitrospinae bacterium RIFCSPHIGHO2_02_39_11]OGW00047.1 MAG: hypothetical protein A3D97_03110 [Nitrospinae bacterium RIFCSPHIGHO2_12_FULL_39_42]OGW01450.1 MAG: hypothetical protein A3D20_00685 [Nitrospinae bacterium RIFCSPHIGHO2_02_FULL_39_82]OGW03610.1 MAG: hypothetical protein A2Z59_04960 [Nitrospinae bacterium RIFCSPLOWO2_02_39_17]OGW05604.1 MAG: hypothetical protein A3I04_05345 [Nitrospinae bacterium RIFCSPLOWO2_02_FULL_39_110]OGW09775.1 MAG: hypoth